MMKGGFEAIRVRFRILGLSAALVAGSLGAVMPSSAAAAETWHVGAGAANRDFSRVASAFYPAGLTVHQGDAIVFSGIGHTVTLNLRPGDAFAPSFGGDTLASSNTRLQRVLEPPNTTFTLKVAASPGSYHYRCAFHPKMEGDIMVKAAGAPLPSTDAQNQAAVKPIIRHDLKVAGQIAEEMEDAAEDAVDIGGTGTEVVAGGGNGVSTVLRFVPQTIEVVVGRKVTFVNRDQWEPHTVTFGPERPFNQSLFPYGDPSNVNAPAQEVNSGVLASKLVLDFVGAPQPPFKANMQYSFTFTKPGVYKYICIFHDEVGMIGQVIVEEDD